MLHISVAKCHLTGCKDSFTFHTRHSETVDFDDLVDLMATGRTTLSKPDLYGAMQLLSEEIQRALSRGCVVRLPFGSLYLTASGSLEDSSEPFVPGSPDLNHDVRLRFRANKEAEIRIVKATKINRMKVVGAVSPVLMACESVRTDEKLAASPSDFVRIKGERLHFDKRNAELGVFFVNGSTYRAAQYATVTNKMVIAQVPPDVPTGQYTVAVSTLPGKLSRVKEGVLEDPLSVLS